MHFFQEDLRLFCLQRELRVGMITVKWIQVCCSSGSLLGISVLMLEWSQPVSLINSSVSGCISGCWLAHCWSELNSRTMCMEGWMAGIGFPSSQAEAYLRVHMTKWLQLWRALRLLPDTEPFCSRRGLNRAGILWTTPALALSLHAWSREREIKVLSSALEK